MSANFLLWSLLKHTVEKETSFYVTMYAFSKYVKNKLTTEIRRHNFIRNEKGKIIIKVRSLELIITLPHIEFQVEFIYRYIPKN